MFDLPFSKAVKIVVVDNPKTDVEILRRDSIFFFFRASLEEEERAEREAETKILLEWREESDGGDKVRED